MKINNQKNKSLYKILNGMMLFSFLAGCSTQSVRQNNSGDVNLQSHQLSGANMQMNTEENEPPFACNMNGMNIEQRQRYGILTKRLQITKQEIKELPDGYAFRLSSEASTVKDAAEWITYERLCCPFFDFGLEVERNGGGMWLRLTGSEGVKPFIRAEFGI